MYQVEQPDSGWKHIVKLAERHCTYLAFQDYQSLCVHTITACRYNGEDPLDYFLQCYTLEYYRKSYTKALQPISIEDLDIDVQIRPPALEKKRGRLKTKRIRKGEHTKLARKCGRCGELGHNSRTYIGLRNRAGRGERARQWQ